MRRVTVAVLVAALALPGAAVAQTGDVVVTAPKPEPVDKIDRRTYEVRDDPDANTGVIVDILRKLPSVTVTTDGQIALRGSAGVTILIDGRVPPEGNDAIKSLPSAEVERIEIMTNPSAQYGPEGSAGIINIVTRKRHKLGITGDLNAQITTRGQGNASVSVAMTQGAWTLGGRLFYDRFASRSRFGLHQEAVNPLSGAVEISDQDDRSTGSSDNGTGGLSLGYRLSDKSRLTVKGEYGNYDSLFTGATTYRGPEAYDETSLSKFGSSHSDFQAQYDFAGDTNGRRLSLVFERSAYSNTSANDHNRVDIPTGDVSVYRNIYDTAGTNDSLTLDYERTFANGRLLTAGASVERTFNESLSSLGNSGASIGFADYVHGFAGTRTLSSAYMTYQMPFGSWMVLPGLRGEMQVLELPGNVRVDDVMWYPSLHLSHDLGDKAKVKLSYSKRIFRPSLSEYDPTVQYAGGMLTTAGNPDLKPEVTHSWEAGYGFADKAFGVDATVYYRQTIGGFQVYSRLQPNGFLYMTSVNARESQAGGAELSLRGPVSKHVKYVLNGNLYYTKSPYFDGVTERMRGQVAGSGNAIVEYDTTGGDQYQVNISGSSKRLTYQGYVKGVYQVDLSYQHPISDKVSLTVNVTDLFNTSAYNSVIDTLTLRSQTRSRPSSQALKIGLAYKLGDAKR